MRNSSNDEAAAGRRPDSHLLHFETTRAIIGQFYETHKQLGYGFAESVYANGLAILLREVGLTVQREVEYDVHFHGEIIGRYRADLVVESKIVVEVKAARAIASAYEDQVRNYLRASNLAVGLLLNFGPSAQFRRLIWTPKGNIAVTR